MFSDKASAKAIVLALIGYLVAATFAMIVVVQIWMPAGVTDAAAVSRMAETDPTLLLWQNALGIVLCIAAGFAASQLSGSRGLRSALILGILLLIYGALGIYLHPSHPMPMQIAKVVSPIPLALLGGWICLRLSPLTRVDA